MRERGTWVAAGVAAVMGWVCGVALLGLHARLPEDDVLWALCVAGSVGVMVIQMPWSARGLWNEGVLTVVLVLVSSALLAHGVAGLRTQARLESRLPHHLEGVPLLIVGTVADLPRRSAQGVQFAFEVESAQAVDGRPAHGVPTRVWLGWWMEGHVEAVIAASVPEPQPGERWQLPVTLKRPHGTQNPGTFDAERWFLEQDLGASGSVLASHRGQARRLGRSVPAWRDASSWRAAVRQRIDAHVADAALAGLVAGLTIGDQSAVDAADWALFRDAGVAHALSISGLHVTAFAALAAPLAAWLWRRSPAACLWWPASMVGAWVGWGSALAYALLAGWGLPAQRTVAMLGVLTLAQCARLNWPPLLVWIAAAAPVVMLDPWAVTQAGFWLSFAAVGLLLLCTRAAAQDGQGTGHGGSAVHARAAAPALFTRGWDTWLGRAVWTTLIRGAHLALGAARTQVVTAVGLAPLAAVCFQQLSVVGVLGNLVALPWITVVLTPLCLAGVVLPPVWGVLPWVVDPLRHVLTWLTAWPGAVVAVPHSGPLTLALALLGAALALMNLPVRLRVAGLLLMLPLLWPPPRPLPHGRFEVWAFDVGQGSAVLVRTREHELLIDAGPAWGEGRDAGDRVVLPALRHLGVRRLNLLVVTHRDIDHAGGVASVLKGLPVHATLSSLEPSHPLRRFPVKHETCRRGQRWEWDGVRFEVLHPFGHEPPQTRPNLISCVLRLEDISGRSVLVTGDIERDQEAALVRDPIGAQALRSDALIVPHHGSKTSSTEPFLRSVQPQWAVAQAGYRNRHGHPASLVAERYRTLDIPLRDTPWCGAWFWNGQGEPECWRERAARHWHDVRKD